MQDKKVFLRERSLIEIDSSHNLVVTFEIRRYLNQKYVYINGKGKRSGRLWKLFLLKEHIFVFK